MHTLLQTQDRERCTRRVEPVPHTVSSPLFVAPTLQNGPTSHPLDDRRFHPTPPRAPPVFRKIRYTLCVLQPRYRLRSTRSAMEERVHRFFQQPCSRRVPEHERIPQAPRSTGVLPGDYRQRTCCRATDFTASLREARHYRTAVHPEHNGKWLFNFVRATSMKSELRCAACGCSGIVSAWPNLSVPESAGRASRSSRACCNPRCKHW